MHYRQKRMLTALRRVQGFLDARADTLTGINATGGRRTIDQVVQALERLAGQQDPTKVQRRAEREAVRKVRDELRLAWFRPIASIAATLLQGQPEFEHLRLPPVGIDDVTLPIVAREMAAAAALHREAFVSAGLAPDFDQTFLGKIAEFETAVAARDRGTTNRLGVTAKVREQSRLGVLAIRVVDALVGPMLKDNVQLLREWASVRKVVLRSTPKEASEQSATPPAVEPVTVAEQPAPLAKAA